MEREDAAPSHTVVDSRFSGPGIVKPLDPSKPMTVINADVSVDGFAPETVTAFRDAARKLKAAESAVAEARAEYAEAVKRLSEEAVR